MNFSNEFPVILVICLLALMITAVFIRPKSKMLTLRVLIYLISFFIFLKPYYSFNKSSLTVARIGIYIDKSKSMSIEHKFNEAEKVLDKLYKRLKDKNRIFINTLGENIKKIEINDVQDIKPSDQFTDISLALRNGNYDIKILITDGRYNKGVDPVLAETIKRYPIYTVGIGSKRVTPDIGIIDLKSPGIAFRDQDVEINFTIMNKTGSEGRVSVTLKEGYNIISRKSVNLNGKEKLDISFKFFPNKIGLKNYTIELSKIFKEINLANNKKNFQLQIKRQRIRILYVAGAPSWEYSLFRRFVRSDPQIELVSFLILRNPDNLTIVSENELALIHFPAREMFTEKIHDFDILIYDNFSYKRFFPMSYLKSIKKFVLDGGGFIMLGGEDSFGRGGYEKTPLNDVLPAVFQSATEWEKIRFKAELADSAGHPILNIADDKETSRQIWSEMPFLEGYDRGVIAKPESAVLLKKSDGTPILIVSNYKKGRSMIMNTNSTWRWCMGLAGEGKTPYYYNQFWYKVIRYLIKTDDQENIQIFPGKEQANVNEKISVNIKLLDKFWKPINDARLQITLQTPKGKRIPLGWVYPTGDDGWYHAVVPVIEEGVHKIKVKAFIGDRYFREKDAEFLGLRINPEMMDTSLDRDLLQKISELSGGIYFDPDNLDINLISSEIINLMSQKRIIKKLNWHHWSILCLLLSIFFIEWYLRRKMGWD